MTHFFERPRDLSHTTLAPELNRNVLERESSLGYIHYELSNHLGNVLATVSDRKLQHDSSGFLDYYSPEVVTSQDYYPFGMLMPGRQSNAGEYRYSFNGMEKDDEWKGSGNSLDFGARIYDSRIGRFLSIDPLAMELSFVSPYHISYNNPVTFLDLWGEKGTIYIQVMLNEDGDPVISKSDMESIKQRIQEEYQSIGVDLSVELDYSNYVMTKDEFYSREGADETDSYVLIGTGGQLDKEQVKMKDKGWEPFTSWGHSVNGTSTEDWNAMVNAENMKMFNGESIWEEPYSSIVEKTALTIMHETGHPKFAGYSKNFNESTMSSSNIGHVGGTIMAPVPKEGAKHDSWMIDKLQEIHGETPEYKQEKEKAIKQLNEAGGVIGP